MVYRDPLSSIKHPLQDPGIYISEVFIQVQVPVYLILEGKMKTINRLDIDMEQCTSCIGQLNSFPQDFSVAKIWEPLIDTSTDVEARARRINVQLWCKTWGSDFEALIDVSHFSSGSCVIYPILPAYDILSFFWYFGTSRRKIITLAGWWFRPMHSCQQS